MLDGKKWRLDSRKEQGIFLSTTTSRPALSSLSLIPKRNPGLFLPGLKQLTSAADHSPQFSAKFKMNGAVVSNFHLLSCFVLK